VCARGWPSDVPKVGQVNVEIAEQIQKFSFEHTYWRLRVLRLGGAVGTLVSKQRKIKGRVGKGKGSGRHMVHTQLKLRHHQASKPSNQLPYPLGISEQPLIYSELRTGITGHYVSKKKSTSRNRTEQKSERYRF